METKTAGHWKAKSMSTCARAVSTGRVARYVISVSPKTHMRPGGTRAVYPARASPGLDTSGSEARRSRGTPGVRSSSFRVSRLASRISWMVMLLPPLELEPEVSWLT